MPDKSKALWRKLYEDGNYTKSFPEFVKQFATPDKINLLHSVLIEGGHYTKPANEFASQFFSDLPTSKAAVAGKRITIKDNRSVDSVTGTPVDKVGRLGGTVDEDHIKQVVEKAKKHGIDPYTALAMNMQETSFKDEYQDNPFMAILKDPTDLLTFQEDPIDYSMQKFSEKQDRAKKQGKSTDAELIQSWNGYGKISSDMGGNKLYGIDISKEPLDMTKNPVYGKRIIDIRDNILKKNPDIVKLVDENTTQRKGQDELNLPKE
jgi:hypothetical protein